jgi:hypothetical protein
MIYRCFRGFFQRLWTAMNAACPFHGGNTGSIPVGRASDFNHLAAPRSPFNRWRYRLSWWRSPSPATRARLRQPGALRRRRCEVSVIPGKTPATMRIGNVDRCPALRPLELALLP